MLFILFLHLATKRHLDAVNFLSFSLSRLIYNNLHHQVYHHHSAVPPPLASRTDAGFVKSLGGGSSRSLANSFL